MLLRLCQLKSLLLLLTLASCSWWGKEDFADKITESAKWFKVNSEHTIVDHEGNEPIHLFYDIDPEFNKNDHYANVVILSTANAPYAFNINLTSGQRYFSHAYCKEKDAWGTRSGTFNRPSYHVGFIPKSLDQLGEPQKVIVIGRDRFTPTINKNYFNVKIVGAYVEQQCPEGNCLDRETWLSRLVFVGVDPVEYESVKDIASLQEKVDWPEVVAELENVDGRNGFQDRSFPAVKVGNLIEFPEAYEYFDKRSIKFSQEELQKVQKSCHALYDAFWYEVGEVREEDKPAKTPAQLSAKLKLRQDLKARGIPVGFSTRFRMFVKKYHKDISTCEKFVYHGNINKNPEKFWFLSYMGMFFRLHEEGHYFDCKRKTWQKNYLTKDAQKGYELVEGIVQCSTQDIDRAMDYMGNYLKGLKGNSTQYYSFIDYDNHVFGTHQKIYSWIKRKNMTFDCSKDPNKNFLKAFNTFPEDAQWKKRDVSDLESDSKIIY